MRSHRLILAQRHLAHLWSTKLPKKRISGPTNDSEAMIVMQLEFAVQQPPMPWNLCGSSWYLLYSKLFIVLATIELYRWPELDSSKSNTVKYSYQCSCTRTSRWSHLSQHHPIQTPWRAWQLFLTLANALLTWHNSYHPFEKYIMDGGAAPWDQLANDGTYTIRLRRRSVHSHFLW